MIVRRAALALLAAGAASARAQQFLYDPEPPPGSAFLRLVNATPEELAVRPDFTAARTLGTTPATRVSPYIVVEGVAGREARLEFGTGRTSLRLEPGGFTTLLLLRRGNTLLAEALRDESGFNQMRARLTFYNATPDCADGRLALHPGGQAVFEGLAPSRGRSRTVNPAAAQLQASCEAGPSPPFALEGLEAGGMYSIWLMRPGAGTPISFMTRDTTERRR